MLLILNACSQNESGTISLNGNAEKADERLEELLEVMKNQDNVNLSALFSKQAISDNENFDDGVTYLLQFFEGEISSWERDRFTFEAIKDNGETSVKLIAWYTIETKEDKYMLFMTDYTINTINPDMQGLYALRVIKAKNEDEEFTYWQDMDNPGIYIPKE